MKEKLIDLKYKLKYNPEASISVVEVLEMVEDFEKKIEKLHYEAVYDSFARDDYSEGYSRGEANAYDQVLELLK